MCRFNEFSYLSDARRESFKTQNDDEPEKLFGNEDCLTKSVFFGVTLFGRRLSLFGQLLLSRVEIRFGPVEEVESMEAGQQERVGRIKESSTQLQQDNVTIVHFRPATNILVEIQLVDQRISIVAPHSSLDLIIKISSYAILALVID